MSKKPITKRADDPDRVNEKEPKLNIEVVEDLDLPQDDAEDIRGGRCTIIAANYIQTIGGV